ncbi:MAG TPA: rhomboid family protein [Alphaproteobacteria bacterium]|nr:rhomboid family protein [Alphaproteobacteria bacterium]
MSSITQQRCFNHALREAVARCPECKQFYCRECVTEHDDRVVCASCLSKLTHKPLARRFALGRLFVIGQALFGFVIAWYFFFLIGHSLSQLPDSFHEGTLWQVDSPDEPSSAHPQSENQAPP